jgi:hypothetical protein
MKTVLSHCVRTLSPLARVLTSALLLGCVGNTPSQLPALTPTLAQPNSTQAIKFAEHVENEWSTLDPHIAHDARGNNMAVWEEFDGARYKIWARRRAAGSDWRSPVQIEHNNTGDAYQPRVALDNSGNAMAVWQQSDGKRFDIWANRYVVGEGWSTAVRVDADSTGEAQLPQIAFDGSGNALAVWQQSDGKRSSVRASRYVPGQGWGSAALIHTSYDHAAAPQITSDASGNAMAVWHVYDGKRAHIWANRFAPATGWSRAKPLESNTAGNAYNPRISLHANGDTVAVWQQLDGTRTSTWARRYAAGAGWGRAMQVEASTSMWDMDSTPAAQITGSSAMAVWVH